MLFSAPGRVRAIALVAALLASSLAGPAYAGTVSTISGTVTDSAGKPLAGVLVTANAPSGRYTAKTDAHGFYSINGVATDTYAVSFTHTGDEPQTIVGVNAAADQVERVNATLQPALRTIATVSARSAGGAFQPHQTADTYTVTQAQIQTIQGSALNLNQKSLITALPGVQYSSGDLPTIRGGRTNNVDYEFEGMNYTDPYTQQNINGFSLPAFGLQSVQVSPGTEDESFGNSGVGTVNVTARRGTYPGTFDAALGTGGPGFMHEADFGYGIATPDGRASEYLSYTAQNTAPRYGGSYWQNDANNIGVYNWPMYLVDRELLSNTVLKFGRDNRFALQVVYNNGMHITDGGYGDSLASQLCYFSCDMSQLTNYAIGGYNGYGYDGLNYNGANHGLTIQQLQELMVLDPGQTRINELLGGRPEYSESGFSNGTKAQLSWNANSSTYVYASWDTTNGITEADQPNSALYRLIGGYNDEFHAGLNKQLSEQHSLRLNVDTDRGTPINEGYFPNDELFNIAPAFEGVGELYDFISPSDPNCPLGTNPQGQSYCGHLYTALGLNPNDPTGTLKLIAGGSGTRITGTSFNYSAGDTWTPNSRLRVDYGVRVEHHRYSLPQYGMLPDCTSYYVPVAYQTPTQGTLPNGETGEFINGQPVGPGNCPQEVFLPLTKDQTAPTVPEPRIATSYQLGANDAVRFSFGRTARFPEGIASDYAPPANFASEFAGLPAYLNPGMYAATGTYNINTPYSSTNSTDYYGTHGIPTDCGFIGHYVPCQTYQEQLYWSVVNGDFANPIAPLAPVTYNNFDFSYSHQFAHNLSFKVTGWSRRAYNLDIIEPIPQENLFGIVIKNPDGSILNYAQRIPTNNGIEIADGLEFYLTKEPTRQYGLTEQLSATYNNVRQNIPPTGADEFHGVLSTNTAGQLFRVGYVSPFTSTFALNYKMRSGWRVQARLDYDIGYPYGDGLLTSFGYGGQTYTVPHTNATGSGLTQFIDPSNPGSVFHPNIAATLGTPETNQAAGSLSHQNLVAEMTLERPIGHGVLGFQVFNLFNEAFSGPTYPIGQFGTAIQGPFAALGSGTYNQGQGFYINNHYQPVATGVGGPLSGYQTNCTPNPAAGQTCQLNGGVVNGRGPYINLPNAIGRSYYLYYTLHV